MAIQVRFDHVARDLLFHAAYCALQPSPAVGIAEHSHDYYELMLVESGTGIHVVNGRPERLEPYALVLVRPPDAHHIASASKQRLEFYNVAFPASTWRRFLSAAGEPESRWRAPTAPVATVLEGPARDSCGRAFRRALHAANGHPTGLDLCACLAEALTHLTPAPPTDERDAPPWLVAARTAINDDPSAGVRRLQQLAGVSDAHLSRTMRTFYGETPTDFVNEVRLTKVALALRTSDRAVEGIAHDTGFTNMSHFYRLFAARFGMTPRTYRRQGAAGVLPPANENRRWRGQ